MKLLRAIRFFENPLGFIFSRLLVYLINFRVYVDFTWIFLTKISPQKLVSVIFLVFLSFKLSASCLKHIRCCIFFTVSERDYLHEIEQRKDTKATSETKFYLKHYFSMMIFRKSNRIQQTSRAVEYGGNLINLNPHNPHSSIPEKNLGLYLIYSYIPRIPRHILIFVRICSVIFEQLWEFLGDFYHWRRNELRRLFPY